MILAENTEDYGGHGGDSAFSVFLCVLDSITLAHQTILVLDFGSQFTQLIARRLRELSVYCEIHPFNTPLDVIKSKRPVGLILSGGPSSVDEDGAPHCERAVLDIGVPTLAICYGMHLIGRDIGAYAARYREYFEYWLDLYLSAGWSEGDAIRGAYRRAIRMPPPITGRNHA